MRKAFHRDQEASREQELFEMQAKLISQARGGNSRGGSRSNSSDEGTTATAGDEVDERGDNRGNEHEEEKDNNNNNRNRDEQMNTFMRALGSTRSMGEMSEAEFMNYIVELIIRTIPDRIINFL